MTEDKQELEYIKKQSKKVEICLAVGTTVVFILFCRKLIVY
jgi:hypothetical protein